MTVIWEGEAGEEELFCQGESMEQKEPLAQIPGTNLWGADLPVPTIPCTVCSFVAVGRPGQLLASPRHCVDLRGPDLPVLEPVGVASGLAEDLMLPAPGLAGEERRVRIYLPSDFDPERSYDLLFATDGQFAIEIDRWFPLASDTARPDLFAGALLWSPGYGEGHDALMVRADQWAGGGRFYISHGNFGSGERKSLPAARRLAEVLGASGATGLFSGA